MAKSLTILLCIIIICHYTNACRNRYLTHMHPTSTLLTQWEEGHNKWNGKKIMKMGDGKFYNEFFVLHPFHPRPGQKLAHRTYALDGKYKTFSVIVGVALQTNSCDESYGNYGSFSIKILVDGKQKFYQNGFGKTGWKNVHIDVTGGKELKIETNTAGGNDNADCDHAAFANPLLTCNLGGDQGGNAKCPSGSRRVTSPQGFNDISGCGLEGCSHRYQADYPGSDACKVGCDKYSVNHPGKNCVAFSWAPMAGDKNHPHNSVCTLYDSATPTHKWGPIQVFCVSQKPQQQQEQESEDEYDNQPQPYYQQQQPYGQHQGEAYDENNSESSEDDEYQYTMPMMDLFIMYGGIIFMCLCCSGIVCMIFAIISLFFITKKCNDGGLKIGESKK